MHLTSEIKILPLLIYPILKCMVTRGVTPELEQENASITLSMPMSRKQRPITGIRNFLENIGFSRSGYDLSVGQNILKEHDLKDALCSFVWGVR